MASSTSATGSAHPPTTPSRPWTRWSSTTPATPPPHSTPQPEVFGRGSCILADGKLIALGEGGLLGLFAPNAARPEEICRHQVPALHYPCWGAPVLSAKKLYLRSEDHLLCLDLAKPQ